MNCTHVINLLPLYITSDLSPQQASFVRTHILSCSSCRELAAEHEANRMWLRESSAPEFNELFFESIRASVWRQIEADQSRKTSWTNLFPQLSWVLAATALLIICGLLLITRKPDPVVPTLDNSEVVQVNPTPQRSDIEANRGVKQPVVQRPINPALRRKQPQIKQLGSPQLEETATKETTEQNAGEITRIEIQTADPNIRIIWLTPKKQTPNDT